MASFFWRIVFVDIFGNESFKDAKIYGWRAHGFITPSGAWSLYEQKGDVPAIYLVVRWKKKRVCSVIREDQIVRIEAPASSGKE